VTRRLVVANRGEIARRILRAGRALGYSVAVVSTASDADSPVRREADAVLEVEGFLAIPAIVEAACAWGAHLLHPGYGYLSENPAFAAAVEEAGIRFVGPSPENMTALGGKESAKAIAKACGVPVLEALLSAELAALQPPAWEEALARRGILAPFLVKASSGGGGRGMRVVPDPAGLPDAVLRASREALASFGDGTVFVERYLRSPRHVEIQVFGDGLGGGVFLGERECSLQRRHQKVVEEAPGATVDTALREAMGRAALALVARTRYRGAGTVEFLLDGEGAFHFLEMNTRLQVEHPVTELVYGVDLVAAQLELAEGRWPGQLGDPEVFAVPEPRGVALEARILAEDPRNGFLPTPGPLTLYAEPSGEGVRMDSGVVQGGRVNAQFDSMIAKLVVWGPDRAQAVARLSRALEETTILGCVTNLPFLQAVARSGDFLAGRESTGWIQEHLAALNAPLLPAACAAFFQSPGFREALACAFRGTGSPASGPAWRFKALAGHPELVTGSPREQEAFTLEAMAEPGLFRLRGPALRRMLTGEVGPHERGPSLTAALAAAGETDPHLAFHACRGEGGTLALAVFGDVLNLADPLSSLTKPRAAAPAGGEVRAPMGGKVLEIHVAPGQDVEVGQLLFVVESMKMQFEITAPAGGRVAAVLVEKDQVLQGPEALATFGS
jgi:acetyl/propionyl-CoA carboxylase alpha subunit